MPTFSTSPMPAVPLHALLTLAILWGRFGEALLLTAGFVGLLRRGELAALRGYNDVFSDLLGAVGDWLFVQIESPKMRRRGARLEHVRIRGALLTAFARAVVAASGAASRVFDGSPAELTKSLSQMFDFFGFSLGSGPSLSWTSLRPGGATFLYIEDTPLDTIKWRGR